MSLSKPVKWNYGEDALAHAAEGVDIRCAAQMYGVPKLTLSDKVLLHTKGKRGPKPVIPAALDRIEMWIVNMARIGYGQTKEQIKNKVQELVNVMKIPTPWVDNCPSEKWYRLYAVTSQLEVSYVPSTSM